MKERGFSGFLGGLRSSIIEHSVISLLKTNEEKWAGKYDIYYSYWLSGFASYLATRKQQLNGTVVARTHGYDCFFERGFHAHRKEQFRGLDAIYTISNAGKADLIAQGCKPDIIHVARLGTIKDSDSMNPYEQKDEKTIVTCSNIVDLKRLDLLINALSGIEDITINWIHFGDGVLKEPIQALAKEMLGDKTNISYEFRGWTAHETILQFYKEHPIDLFVNCSDVEGVPVSIMEAMSYGIPCIARNVGGNSEIVNNDNGVLLSSDCSIQDLTDSIMQMLNMPSNDYLTDTKAISQFVRKGIAGEDIILKSAGTQNYSYTYMADAISGLLTILLKGESGEAYNIADEASNITLKDLAEIIASYAGKQVVFEIPDATEAAGYSKATKALLDGSKLRMLGWKPFYTIQEGIPRTMDILKTSCN